MSKECLTKSLNVWISSISTEVKVSQRLNLVYYHLIQSYW
jgi:hypothetical protein